MTKKNSNGIGKTLSWVIPSLIGLAFLVLLVLFFTGVIKLPFQKAVPSFGGLDIINLFGQQPSGDCTFKVDDNEVCLFDNVTGTIGANSPICYIGYNYNNDVWRFAGVISETSSRFYEESRQATVTGNYIFTAICGTPQDFCRTNNVEVDVILCDDDDGDEGCDYTCGWVGEQCGGTCPGDYPLCVDMWVEDNALFGDNGYSFCACINPNTEEVHPDWKLDGDCHDDSGFPDGNGDIEDIEDYNCGQGDDAQCGGTCPSDYPFCLDVYTGDLFIYSCMCINSNDEVHPDWKPDGDMFNEQGEYPEEPVLNCIDSDGVNPFVIGTTTYLGISHPDVCHAGWGSAVDEYVCIDDVAVKKEIHCPNSDCVDGRCTSGTTTVYQECLSLGYKDGGYCSSSSTPNVGCVLMPSLDTTCGDLYPLNPAKCCN